MNGDPRRIGDRCVFGWSKTVYTIVGWDGVDWLVVWETGKRGILSRYWNPAAGDRILTRAPRPACGRVPRQLSLFPPAA